MRIGWKRNHDEGTKAGSAVHTSATSTNAAAPDFVMTLATRGNNESSREVITMVQAAEARHGDNLRTRSRIFCEFSICRRLLAQPKVSSVLVIIADVFVHQPFQMALIEHDYMVEQVAAATADEALGDSILPRALERSANRFHAKCFCCFDDLGAECGIAVVNQITRRGVIRESLAQLLRYPRAGRMPGHIEMQNAPPVMRDDEKAIQHSEGECGDRKEIHCGNGLAMIAQKRCPEFDRGQLLRFRM